MCVVLTLRLSKVVYLHSSIMLCLRWTLWLSIKINIQMLQVLSCSFVLSLADVDPHLMMEDESLVWTSNDVVIVLQHQNEKIPLRWVAKICFSFSSQAAGVCLVYQNFLVYIMVSIIASLIETQHIILSVGPYCSSQKENRFLEVENKKKKLNCCLDTLFFPIFQKLKIIVTSL